MAMTKPAFLAHRASVLLMGIAVLVATGIGFSQSWAGLYGWAISHGLTEWKALSFPGMVDLFIGVGELGLFALALEGHRLNRGLAWADLALPLGIAAGGWGVSLAFNVGHVTGTWQNKLTAGVPPVASMLGLFVLLRTLHRLVSHNEPAPSGLVRPRPETSAENTSTEPSPGQDPGQPDNDQTARQFYVTDIPSAVISARMSGLTYREIAEAFGITKYRVEEILKPLIADAELITTGQPGQLQPASVNGHHHPDGEDQ